MKAEIILKYLNAQDYFTLKQLATEELRNREVKKTYGNTEAKRIKAAEQYLKRNYTIYAPWKSLVNKENIYGSSMKTFTNGFTAFLIKDLPIESYNPENLEVKPMKIEPIFNSTENLNNQEILLNVAEITAYYKEVKALKTLKSENKWGNNLYKLGSKCFNLQYLKEVFDILGTDDIHFYSDDNTKTPSIFRNKNDYAIIMPVNVKDEKYIINK